MSFVFTSGLFILVSWLKMCLAKEFWEQILESKELPRFQKGLNMFLFFFFTRPITRPHITHSIYWGVIVHLVMEAKFIFFIT